MREFEMPARRGPNRMPRRKVHRRRAPRRSYHISGIAWPVLAALAGLAMCWALGEAYQVGFRAGLAWAGLA